MSLRIAVVTLTILAMTATALVFGSQGPASANEPLATDSPAEDPTAAADALAAVELESDDAAQSISPSARSLVD